MKAVQIHSLPLDGTISTSEPIRYDISTAEAISASASLPIQDNSVDQIAAAISAHWFDIASFWLSAARVLNLGCSVIMCTSGGYRIHPSVPTHQAIQAEVDETENKYAM
ncbi:hypothetical protein N7541_006703 [Penicillium brevicompactum]|uniref:Methyltransferase type 11 domain-containing protein n=1 Tax=Penicillium brevicompactum TaxID=5074 RepID=A0A9W9R8F9_PENBR|nr:hypothetical protein N7541_006703 [Penicillium brevicompactum]